MADTVVLDWHGSALPGELIEQTEAQAHRSRGGPRPLHLYQVPKMIRSSRGFRNIGLHMLGEHTPQNRPSRSPALQSRHLSLHTAAIHCWGAGPEHCRLLSSSPGCLYPLDAGGPPSLHSCDSHNVPRHPDIGKIIPVKNIALEGDRSENNCAISFSNSLSSY